MGRLTAGQIRTHPFFKGLQFNKLLEMEPPIKPLVKGPLDTSNFDNFNGADNNYNVSSSRHQVVKDPSLFAFHDYGYRRDLEAKKPSVTMALSSAEVPPTVSEVDGDVMDVDTLDKTSTAEGFKFAEGVVVDHGSTATGMTFCLQNSEIDDDTSCRTKAHNAKMLYIENNYGIVDDVHFNPMSALPIKVPAAHSFLPFAIGSWTEHFQQNACLNFSKEAHYMDNLFPGSSFPNSSCPNSSFPSGYFRSSSVNFSTHNFTQSLDCVGMHCQPTFAYGQHVCAQVPAPNWQKSAEGQPVFRCF